MSEPEDRTDVLIAGGGPVGLALAVELGMRGVRCCLVEPRDRSRLTPRAKLTNVRSMEHLRRWGLADKARAAAPLPPDHPKQILFVTHMHGHELTRFRNVFASAPGHHDAYAEAALQIPQPNLEPVLRARIDELPNVETRDGWRLAALRQHPDRVECELAPGEGGDRPRQRITARYLAGCDGPRSTVREQLAIAMTGRTAIARNFGVTFRSRSLTTSQPFDPALHYWIVNPGCPAYMGPWDAEDLWWFQATAVPEQHRRVRASASEPAGGDHLEDFDPLRLVHAAIGDHDDVEILERDPWVAHALVADRIVEGRVLLLGDAAHLNPPMGAHGMNTGIGDAVDAGWKLAAVLQGWGAPSLVDSYQAERGRLHPAVIDEAARNYSTLANHFVETDLDDDGPAGKAARARVGEAIQREKYREFHSLGFVLGVRYVGSPLIAYDEDTDGQAFGEVTSYTPCAAPGHRAPHAWLRDGSSLFDHFGWGFTLLCLADDAQARSGCADFQAAARQRRVPLTTVTLPDTELRALYDTRFALLRPDQHIAWRGDQVPTDPGWLLDLARGGQPGRWAVDER